MLKKIKEYFENNEISRFDYIFTFVILVFCFLSFQQYDLVHTTVSSYTYLKGHILDFYEYNVPFVEVNNYLPSTYILFAIWYIPLKILGFVNEPIYQPHFSWILFYGKLLPTLFYLGTGYFVYKISLFIGMGETKAKICSYAFITMPIAVYSQFIFGQYDIFTTFFIVVGFYFWLKNDFKKFIFFFGIAITFKYLSFIIFLVLLLIKEKKVQSIIRNCLLVSIPFLIETLVYIRSTAFKHGVFGFGALQYTKLLNARFSLFQLYLPIFLLCIIVAACYFKKCKNSNEELITSLFFINFVMFCFFGLSYYHQQWFLMAIPFWVISSFLCENQQIYLLLHLMLMALYIIVGVNIWPTAVDQIFLSLGIWSDSFPIKYLDDLTMSSLCKSLDISLLYTFFSALILCQAIFKSEKYCLTDFKVLEKRTLLLVKSVFVIGISIFVIPAFYCGIKVRSLDKQDTIVSLTPIMINQIIIKKDNNLVIENNLDPFIVYDLEKAIDGKDVNYLLIDFDKKIFDPLKNLEIQLYWSSERYDFTNAKSLKYYSKDGKILLSLPDSFKKENNIKRIRIDFDNSKIGDSFEVERIKLLK